VHVTFEEGTSAAWLYDLLKPHVTKLVVCDPRKNASMREGNQSDKIDARRLAELLRLAKDGDMSLLMASLQSLLQEA
jgi:transposase